MCVAGFEIISTGDDLVPDGDEKADNFPPMHSPRGLRIKVAGGV